MWQLRKENWLLLSKGKKVHRSVNDELLNQLLLSLGCWLILPRRFCVYNAGLKVDVAREILSVIMIMTSNDKNVRSCKRHTVVRRTFCFWRSLCLFLVLQLTTMSLDVIMTSNDENVHLYKRHTVVRCAFCFWRSLCPFFASWLATMSINLLLNQEQK